jgi:hypothetical protein
MNENEQDYRQWIDAYVYARNTNTNFTNEVYCDQMTSSETNPSLNDNDDDLPF